MKSKFFDYPSDIGKVKETDPNVLKKRLSYWIGTYWVEFDDVYMKPKLVHNWPEVKKDNDNIARRIKNNISEYNSKKMHGGLSTAGILGLENQESHEEESPKKTKMNSKNNK